MQLTWGDKELTWGDKELTWGDKDFETTPSETQIKNT